jgi:hypothetical protein
MVLFHRKTYPVIGDFQDRLVLILFESNANFTAPAMMDCAALIPFMLPYRTMSIRIRSGLCRQSNRLSSGKSRGNHFIAEIFHLVADV